MAAAVTQEVQNGSTNGKTGGPTVTFTGFKPQIVVEAPKGNDAVTFYKAAFGAEEVSRAMHPKRKADQELPLVLSADLKLGPTFFSVADSSDDSPLVKTGGVFCLETEDVEGAINKAVSAGATAEGDVAEVEGAGRVGKLKDPYGNIWVISSSSPAAATTTTTTTKPAEEAPAADVAA